MELVQVDTDRDSDSSRPAARAAAPGRSPGAYARVGSGGVARVGASERPAAAHRDSDLRRRGFSRPGTARRRPAVTVLFNRAERRRSRHGRGRA